MRDDLKTVRTFADTFDQFQGATTAIAAAIRRVADLAEKAHVETRAEPPPVGASVGASAAYSGLCDADGFPLLGRVCVSCED